MKYIVYKKSSDHNHTPHHHDMDHMKSDVVPEQHSKYHREYVDINRCLETPPATWAQYARKADGDIHITEMEIAELQSAVLSHSYADIIENLIHVAAACVAAHNKMTCDKP